MAGPVGVAGSGVMFISSLFSCVDKASACAAARDRRPAVKHIHAGKPLPTDNACGGFLPDRQTALAYFPVHAGALCR